MHKFIQTICLFTYLLFTVNTQAQIINIPDANFKAKLLQANTTNSTAKDSLGNSIKVDINSNGEIEHTEALNVFRLYVDNSNISSLDGINYFSKLRTLHCFSNQLSSLNVSGLINLQFLNFYNNTVSNLNIENLYNLKELYCNGNNLIVLNLQNLNSLRVLHCYDNLIAQLDVSNLLNLKTLYCFRNNLTAINLSGTVNLEQLSCARNKLKYIDISDLKNLYLFECDYNQLFAIYMKDGVNHSSSISTDYSFQNNNNLRYICSDSMEISVIKQRLLSQSVSNVTVNSFCSSTLDGTNYILSGKNKYDSNNNGCNSTDPVFPYLRIKIKNAIDSGYAIADIQGNFTMNLDSGSYTITPQLPNNYFNCTPTSTTVTFPEDTIPQQFCIIPNGTHHDVSVTIIPVRAARPGFSDARYKIVLKNKGNQIESGSILFSNDESKQDYISATATPTNIASGALTFSFSNLQLFETREIIVTMRTNAPTDNPAVNVGDVLILSVSANINADENLSDNFQTLNQTVVASFDPNDKTCLEGDIITPALIGDYVHYLIRFENTGTANAENVVVTDFIDLAKFDIATLEITSTSHSCKTLISNGNKVQFVFDNINLPFTEPLKHGYVAFKIKLKNNLVIGDSLKNKADIYFDYNLPITTNTATSRIETVTTIKTNAKKEGSLSVYPNPSNGNFIVNFESKGNNPILIRVTDLNGKTIYEQKTTHQNRSVTPIELQNLPNGMYQLQISTDKDVWMQKLLIVK